MRKGGSDTGEADGVGSHRAEAGSYFLCGGTASEGFRQDCLRS